MAALPKSCRDSIRLLVNSKSNRASRYRLLLSLWASNNLLKGQWVLLRSNLLVVQDTRGIPLTPALQLPRRNR